MDYKILKTIYNIGQNKRVTFFQDAKGTYGFEDEYFSEKLLDMCWIQTGKNFLPQCDSLETAIQEARKRISWLDEQWDKIDFNVS